MRKTSEKGKGNCKVHEIKYGKPDVRKVFVKKSDIQSSTKSQTEALGLTFRWMFELVYRRPIFGGGLGRFWYTSRLIYDTVTSRIVL